MKSNTALALMLLSLGNTGAIQAQENKNPKFLRVSLPGKSWALQVDAEGFVVDTDETKPGGRRYLLATNPATKVTLSITLEAVREPPSLEGCRDVFAQRMRGNAKLNPVDVKESQVGGMAVQEYIFPEVKGVPIQQKNFFACFAKDDSYVDIHLSKIKFTPQDEALFAAILNATHLTSPSAADAAGAEPDSSYYFGEGNKYFLQNGFAQAMGPYRKALDLEKKNRKLDAASWRQLIDNLGTAYRKTGDLKSAEEVFIYGISSDQPSPLFYYGWACVSADRNDLKETMKRLEIAFGLQSVAAALGPRLNIAAAGPLPDPRKDACFERFLQEKKFRKLLDSF